MESGVAHLLKEARKSGKPIQTVRAVDEIDLRVERRERLKEEAEERRMIAKYRGPINQEISDARRERDYYKGLISENVGLSVLRNQVVSLKLSLETQKKSYEKKLASLKPKEDFDKIETLKYKLEEARMQLKHNEQLVQKLIYQRDYGSVKYSPSKAMVDMETLKKEHDKIQFLEQQLGLRNEENAWLKKQYGDASTAYNRLVFLVKKNLPQTTQEIIKSEEDRIKETPPAPSS